jgi:tetratricopeptide (TPR) repeat protein
VARRIAQIVYFCRDFQKKKMMLRLFLTIGLVLWMGTDMRAQTPQQWRDSLAVLNKQIRRFPKSTDLRLRKAAVNIELGQWEYAIEEYGNVLMLDEKNLAALYFRAYAHSYLKHYDLARYDYERFLALVPRNFDAQLGLAMVKRKMGRKADAMDDLNQLVQMYPDSTLAYAARAGYEAELGMYEVALFDWDEAIRLSPLNADLVVSKVDLLLSQKRNTEAWEELEKAMKRGIPRNDLREWIRKCK